MSAAESARPVPVGLSPWLPWPFCAWPWWHVPVRAERLAVLRIGTAFCLVADILINYAPHALVFFGVDQFAGPGVLDWRFRAPRMTWSLLRGVGDEANLNLSLGIWLLLTAWVVGVAGARLLWGAPRAGPGIGTALALATCAFACYGTGLWSRMIAAAEPNSLAWQVPLAAASITCVVIALEILQRLRDPAHLVPWVSLGSAAACSLVMLAAGFMLSGMTSFDSNAWWVKALGSWQTEAMLPVMVLLWIASAFLLMMGCCTRLAAVMAYLLSMSFANSNSYLDNAGDTIRLIILFYLMLCPCGAVWSVDALWKKPSGHVYVHPWPLRLLFVQLIFIYAMNGYYKLFGTSWLEGSSLYYVLGDMALTRFSGESLPLPVQFTKLMTWTVLAWEVSFPLLVLWKWTRLGALAFGLCFHLGIFATMELGCFVPYALCLYLPLLPWERACGTEKKASR